MIGQRLNLKNHRAKIDGFGGIEVSKKVISLIVAVITVFSAGFLYCFADSNYKGAPETVSEAYVVMDAATGQVLIEKNMHSKKYPASITKIMTTLLALENVSLDDKVTISKSVYTIPKNSSHVALIAGEILTVEQLVYATMLPSANDAAIGLAEHIGGSISEFAEMMNEKAKELGALDTHFTNPHGLPDENHYTTPYDMAVITRYALGVEGFREVFGTSSYTCSPTNLQSEKRYFHTEVLMLNKSSDYYYANTVGGKFGWTEDSKYTAVTVAQKDGMELICVIMKTNQRYDRMKEMKKLFEYCFDNFNKASISFDGDDVAVQVYDGSEPIGQNYVNVNVTTSCILHKSLSEDNISAKLEIPEVAYTTEEFLPRMSISLDGGGYMYGGELGEVMLDYSFEMSDKILETDVFVIELKPTVSVEKDKSKINYILIIAGIVLAIFAVIILCIRSYNIRKYRTIRRRKLAEKYRKMQE